MGTGKENSATAVITATAKLQLISGLSPAKTAAVAGRILSPACFPRQCWELLRGLVSGDLECCGGVRPHAW